MRPATFLLAAIAMSGVVSAIPAQEAGPRTDALLARAEHGDLTARKETEQLGWLWLKRAAENPTLNRDDARAMARTMLFLEGPPPSLEAPPTDNDRIWRAGAIHALEMAIAQDSSDVWSVEQLVNIAPYPYLWTTQDGEIAVLRALVSRQVSLSAPLQVRRIRLELERGSADSAAAWFATLPPNAMTTAGHGHLAAEIGFGQRHDSSAATAYYSGAAAITDSADAAWYTRDLAWITQPDELAEWNRTPVAEREAWLEKFWNRRDIDDGQLPGTRLPEQFRRWRVALRNFRWDNDGSTVRAIIVPLNDGTAYNRADTVLTDRAFVNEGEVGLVYLNRFRPLTRLVDDRGGLVLRHGEPFQIADLPGVNPLQEATFKWLTPEGPLIVSFSRMADVAFGLVVPSQRYGMVARNYPSGDLDANCHVDIRLCVPITPARHGLIVEDYTRMRERAERTDANAETFKNDLGAIIEAYGIPDRGTLVVYALPVKGLVPDDKERAHVRSLAARLRIVAGDSRRGEFAAVLDTVRSWRLDAAPNDSTQLTGFLLLPTPVGDWTVSVVLSDLARIAGTGQKIFGVPVSGFDGKTLQLSDLILGSPESGLSWTHDGTRIPLNPRNAWRANEPAVLTYQADGLTRGHGYETHIEIWDADPKAKTFKNSVSFTTSATDTHTMIQRELSLRELSAGDYRIIVRLRDTTTGSEVVRERLLAVRK